MQDELIEFKKELHFDIDIGSLEDNVFSEESFFELIREQLEDAGIVDNIQKCFFRDTIKGQRIDGYGWNPLESTFCAIVTLLSDNDDELDRLNRSDALVIANRVRKFIEAACDPIFKDKIDPSTDAFECASFLTSLDSEILKFRIIIITDYVISDRVKSITLGSVMNTRTSVELWDLSRLRDLAFSDSDTEPFTIDEEFLGVKGLPVIKGANLLSGAQAFLGVMPATILSRIYDEYGQRLLEGNVRTFLDFRSGVNRGLRVTLATEPENFFAYNNGITLTADSAEVIEEGSVTYVNRLKNLQIVNGGQTTAAIYFAPKEPGGVKTPSRELLFKDIDLSKVSVQMKLTVFNESTKDNIDEYRSNISNFANSQNSIQNSDLVSNHPIHLSIERLSRQISMPTSETGLASKWFYERTRGQYSTKMRALSMPAKNKFKIEYPKDQVFTKTDMAKYLNTWRMRPFIVKKGAQANLKALGPELIKEYEKDPANFEAGFYKELVAQAILFKAIDKGVASSEWYKQESGLKAEAVTFGIALLRHQLLASDKDINLEKIYSSQALSESLQQTVLYACQQVRSAISNANFRGGVGNPSEFCKSENGWKRIQQIKADLTKLANSDILTKEQVTEAAEESQKLNQTSESLNDFENIISKGVNYWKALTSHNLKHHRLDDIQVAIPIRCSSMIEGRGKPLSPKQCKAAIRIMKDAEQGGFEFSNTNHI